MSKTPEEQKSNTIQKIGKYAIVFMWIWFSLMMVIEAIQEHIKSNPGGLFELTIAAIFIVFTIVAIKEV